MNKMIVAAVLLLVLIVGVVTYLALSRGVFDKDNFTSKTTLKGKDYKSTGHVQITRKSGNLEIHVRTYMPIDIVGTPAYEGWLVNRLTGDKISIGRMERMRDGEYQLDFKSMDPHYGWNKVVISKEDNPYDGVSEVPIMSN